MGSDCSPGMSQQAADIGLLNFKHGYDVAFSRDNQSILDNQEDARAWDQLKLRVAQNAASVDNFIAWTSAQATSSAEQTGQTENEQTVSPVRTGTGDAIVGSVGISADAVAASQANLLSSLTPVIASAVANDIVTAVSALYPILVTASGGASTPSQTKAPTS
jgi:hypothetical protein